MGGSEDGGPSLDPKGYNTVPHTKLNNLLTFSFGFKFFSPSII